MGSIFAQSHATSMLQTPVLQEQLLKGVFLKNRTSLLMVLEIFDIFFHSQTVLKKRFELVRMQQASLQAPLLLSIIFGQSINLSN